MHKRLVFSQHGIRLAYNADITASEKLNVSHCHDVFEILCVLDGHGRYIIEGSEYEMTPGTLIFVRPFEYHCVEIDRDTAYERYVINFSASALAGEAEKLLADLSATGDGMCRFYSAHSVSHALVSAFERFDIAETLPEDKRGIYAQTLLAEIIVLLSAADADAVLPDSGELGARVIRYLNDHIDKNMSLDRIARHFFVSKYYLCRAFKKHNGISIHGYLTQKRVMYAKQLIESGESASGAAYRVGFGDYSAFYRAYLKVLGTSPLAAQHRKDSL